MVKKSLTCASTHWGLNQYSLCFGQLVISWQYLIVFKYQVDKDKYVKFLIRIHQTKLFEIGLPVERSIWFLGQGKTTIWPIVPPPSSCKITFCLTPPPPLVMKNHFLANPPPPSAHDIICEQPLKSNHILRLYKLSGTRLCLDLKGSSKKVSIGLFRLSHSQKPSLVPSLVPFLG